VEPAKGLAQGEMVYGSSREGYVSSGNLENNLHKYGEFTPKQLEQLYAIFKEFGSHHRISGKSFHAIFMDWVLDSDASHHMTGNSEIIQNFYELANPIPIMLPHGYKVAVKQVGTAKV